MEAGFDLKALPVVILGGGGGRSGTQSPGEPLTDSRIDAAGFERLAQQMAASASPSEKKRACFSFRPRPGDPEQQRAWEILQTVPEGKKTAFVAGAILRSRKRKHWSRHCAVFCGRSCGPSAYIRPPGGNSARPDAGFSGRSVKAGPAIVGNDVKSEE